MFLPVLAFLASFSLAGCAAEAQKPDGPEPALELTGRVVDAADILSPGFEREMTENLARLEKRTRVQLVVATTPGLDGRTIESYALDLGNAWGLGDAERNDGLLILVAPDERRVRIEVGLGLEQAVQDEEAKTIIENDMIPHFKQGDFESGITAGTASLAREVARPDMREAA